MQAPVLRPAAQPEPKTRIVPEARPEAQPEEEQLLASVDKDVARQVPSAMEPLAQLMTDEEETR
jgi:formaldehyde-activating enzyme involved in methanogenesis